MRHLERMKKSKRICRWMLALLCVELALPMYAADPDDVKKPPAQGGGTKSSDQAQISKAEQGDADAQSRLGCRYLIGDGIEKNHAEAIKWFRKAAEQGDAKAQGLLAMCYKYGKIVTKDLVQAAVWYRKAAEQGNATGQFMLGTCYADGEGVTKDPVQAVVWFRKAAEQGDADAQYSLGNCYANGFGIGKNLVEAAIWFRKAAEQGDADAQYSLGNCYANGFGIGKNLVEAAIWYHKAAAQGDADAQVMLGQCYDYGDGVTADPVEAGRWYRKAARQGDEFSHYRLGLHFENGLGVIQDDVKACVHFLIASALGFAEGRQKVNDFRLNRLSAADYATAQQVATKWMADFRSGRLQAEDQSELPVPPSELRASATGSGFIISTDGYFLTCSHVIEDAREVKVRIGDKTHPAKLVRADRRNDVALLKLEGSDFRPLSLSQSPPDMGDKVFTVGFPNPEIQGASAKYTDGAISALTGILDDIRTMQVTVPIQGGNSGGALVDAAGNVVGLVVAQLNAVKVFEYTGAIPQNVNFAVKINYALPLIQAVPGLSRRLPQQPKAGAIASPVKAVEAATGLVFVYE